LVEVAVFVLLFVLVLIFLFVLIGISALFLLLTVLTDFLGVTFFFALYEPEFAEKDLCLGAELLAPTYVGTKIIIMHKNEIRIVDVSFFAILF
jgi:hypothetical protein